MLAGIFGVCLVYQWGNPTLFWFLPLLGLVLLIQWCFIGPFYDREALGLDRRKYGECVWCGRKVAQSVGECEWCGEELPLGGPDVGGPFERPGASVWDKKVAFSVLVILLVGAVVVVWIVLHAIQPVHR
jgi:hypothetical protein